MQFKMTNKKELALVLVTLIGISACGTVDSQAAYTSTAPRNTDTLVTPPGLNSPDLVTSYKMAPTATQQVQNGYQLATTKGMHIAYGGSQRWLVIESKDVNSVWPMVSAFINQIGLTVKYQNQSIGVMQTDWAARNNKVPQGTSIRGFFDWVGWGSMYSLNSMYMYRITLWQNGKDVVLMDTNYQMDEEYEGCRSPGIADTSTLASSDQQRTKWIPRPSNPQLELEFLTQYMAFAGMPEEQVKKIVATAESAPKTAALVNNQVVVNDQFDRAWWRTAIALDRVGLGVVDKNRSSGDYYVYPLQAQMDNPDPSFIQRWFGSESANAKALPKPVYTVKLIAQGNQTLISLTQFDNSTPDKDFTANQKKYLTGLAQQLQ